MIKLLIILQLFMINVDAIRHGDYYYAKVSPAKAFGNEELFGGVMLIKCDSSLYGTQHWQFFDCRVPYFRLRCDIVQDNTAYYMEIVDYLNDRESLKQLTE